MAYNRTEFRNLLAAAQAHYKGGRLVEAEALYRAVLAAVPAYPVASHNLGIVLAAKGELRPAIACFDEALAGDISYASAHYNRGVALMALGEPRAAAQGFTRACTIDPEHYEAHRALGFLWLLLGERGRALDHFARTYELRRGDDRTGRARRSLTESTRDKLLHDAEQFRYLAERRRDGQRFEALARSYETVAQSVPVISAALTSQQAQMLGDFNTAIHLRSTPEVKGHAVAERFDRSRLAEEFAETGVTHADNLLTPTAFESLRLHLLESTIWHDSSHIGGFVASYLEDGLACPLLLQIVDELRHALPELLSAYPLIQAWAFKGLRSGAAVAPHADDAAVSINFWVTPGTANQDPGRGGLVLYLAPPPADWRLQDYETDSSRIVPYLEQYPSSSLVMPYRENRAVIFKSRLFHHSDAPKFAAGYENKRINVTFLFGAAG